MPEITQNITLSILNSKGEMFKNSAGVTYTFQVNPNKLDIAEEVQVVESQFLRQDGGIIRPTQVKLRKITGSGKFFDIPESSADSYPLVAKGAKRSAFDAYADLSRYMKTKSVMRLFHQYIGEIYVIIQSLSISNTPSPNSIDFSFSFMETMVDDGRTGFERDKNKQVPGMAVSSNATIQYDTYVVKSGDTLSKIALMFYGNASKWTTIADYNTDILVNGPNVLKVGWILKIPKSTSAPLKRSGGVTPKTDITKTDVPVEINTSSGIKKVYDNIEKVYEVFFPDPLFRPRKPGSIELAPLLTRLSPQNSVPFILNTLSKILPKTPPLLDAPTRQKGLQKSNFTG